MLPKRQRIARKEFPNHTERRTKWIGKFLSIQYIVYARSGSVRFTVVISKKNIALATRRNKVRRAIYDIIRDQHGQFSRFGEAKFIISPQKGAQNATHAEITSDIISFLKNT